MKKIFYVVPIIALLAVGCNSASKPSNQQSPSDDTSQTGQMDNPGNGGIIQTNESVWIGTLKNSDNKTKGNLMLVSSDHTIYINTKRDFSTLIGKDVAVTYSGTLDNFSLTDISAK